MSTEIADQALPAPVGAMLCGIGFQLQRRAPVRASKALTTPLGLSTRSLSATDDDEGIHDRRRRGFLVFAAAGDIGDAAGQIDLSGGAEIGARPPRYGIEREESRIDRRQKNPPAAYIAPDSAGIGPQCDAAIDEAFGIGRAQVDLRIEAPLLPAGLGVESDDPIERRTQIHSAVRDDRRRLEFALATAIASVGNIAGMVFPGDLQLRDVVLIDLGQQRVAAAARVAAVKRPIGSRVIRGFRRSKPGSSHGRDNEDSGPRQKAHP